MIPAYAQHPREIRARVLGTVPEKRYPGTAGMETMLGHGLLDKLKIKRLVTV